MRNKRVLLCAVLLLLLCGSAFPTCAWGDSAAAGIVPADQAIRFSAACTNAEEICQGVCAGADYISIPSGFAFSDALQAVEDAKKELTQQHAFRNLAEEETASLLSDAARIKIIVDVTDATQADTAYRQAKESDALNLLCLRFHTAEKVAAAWLDGKKDTQVTVIGYYCGNIVFTAISRIGTYAGNAQTAAVQLQTKNSFGVVLHNTVTKKLEKFGVKGMFSFADPTVSAGRMDCAQSWDDLIAHGYTVIETAYPEDFAEYLSANTSERQKLVDCVASARTVSTQNCPSNRVKEYNKAIAQVKALIKKGNNSTVEMTQARVRLDNAVRNLSVTDSKTVKGDFAITPVRIGAGIFGICFVVALQVFFRSRWAKKK